MAARAGQVKQMRGELTAEERGEWLRSNRLLREWGWSSRWDGPGCGWGWEEAAGGGYSIMQAQAEARGREQALARGRGGQGAPYGPVLREMHRLHWLRHRHRHGHWWWHRQWHRPGSTQTGCIRHRHGHRRGGWQSVGG